MCCVVALLVAMSRVAVINRCQITMGVSSVEQRIHEADHGQKQWLHEYHVGCLSTGGSCHGGRCYTSR